MYNGIMARALVSSCNSNTALDIQGYAGIYDQTAQAGSTSTTFVLHSGAPEVSATDNTYIGCYIRITGGTGSGQIARVIAYDSATTTATITPDWTTAPDNTSVYRLYGISGISAGAARGSITLDASAGGNGPAYVGAYVRITNGTGIGQHRKITGYDSTTKVATVTPDWGARPVVGSTYVIFGEGGAATAAASGTITLSVDALQASVDNFYNTMMVEITQSSTAAAAVGQIRTIESYDGTTRVATLSDSWQTTPSGTIVYRILPGWGGQCYDQFVDYSMWTVQIIGQAGQYGIHEASLSMTNTGINSADKTVSNFYTGSWGDILNNGKQGETEHTHAVTASYARVSVIVFSDQLQGGIQSRYAIAQNAAVSHTTEDHLSQGADCALVRSIVAAKVEGSEEYLNLHTNTAGELAINLPVSSFGDMRVAEMTPQIQVNFVNETGPQEIVTFKGGAQSTIRHETSQYKLRLGDKPFGTPSIATGDYAVIRTKNIGRYRAGLGAVARWATVFSPPNNSLLQFAGLATPGNALEFGYGADVSDGSQVKFGVNRASQGRSEVRVLEITGSVTTFGNLRITMPNFPSSPALGGTGGAGGNTTFDVFVNEGDTAEEVARKIAEQAYDGDTWENYQWDVQQIATSVIFRSVGVGPRDEATGMYTFNPNDVTGISASQIQQTQVDGLANVYEINVRTGATDTGDITISLGSMENVIALVNPDHATPEAVAWMIVNSPGTNAWADIDWKAEIVSDTTTRVRFTSLYTWPLTGSFDFVDTDTTGVTLDTFLQRQQGAVKVDDWTFQSNWNIDPCDGTGPSRFRLDPTVGNVYAVGYQYLGFGGITYMIENPVTTKFMPVHRIEYAGTSADTHLENPHMPIRAAIHCIDGDGIPATTHTLSIASAAFFTEGPLIHFAPRFAVESYLNGVPSSSGGERLIVAIKHPEIFTEGPSQIGVFIRNIRISQNATGADMTKVWVRIDPVFSEIEFPAKPLWENVSYPYSPMISATKLTISQDTSYDIAQVGVSGGQLIAASGGAGDNWYDLDLNDYVLPRGSILTVSCNPVNNADIRASIEWVEDH